MILINVIINNTIEININIKIYLILIINLVTNILKEKNCHDKTEMKFYLRY